MNFHSVFSCGLWGFTDGTPALVRMQVSYCRKDQAPSRYLIMTASYGNIFHVTDPLWGESAGYRWIPLTNASDTELWCFLRCSPEHTVEQTIEMPVFKTPLRSLWHHCNVSQCWPVTMAPYGNIKQQCVKNCLIFKEKKLPRILLMYNFKNPFFYGIIWSNLNTILPRVL